MRAVPVQLRDSTSWRQRRVLAYRSPSTGSTDFHSHVRRDDGCGADCAQASAIAGPTSPTRTTAAQRSTDFPRTDGTSSCTGNGTSTGGRRVDAAGLAFRPDPPPPASILGRLAVDPERRRQRDTGHRPGVIRSPIATGLPRCPVRHPIVECGRGVRRTRDVEVDRCLRTSLSGATFSRRPLRSRMRR